MNDFGRAAAVIPWARLRTRRSLLKIRVKRRNKRGDILTTMFWRFEKFRYFDKSYLSDLISSLINIPAISIMDSAVNLMAL